MHTMAEKDYLPQLLGNIESQVSRIDRKQDAQNTKLDRIEQQTTRTNGRVDTLENKVQRLEGTLTPKQMPTIWHDKKTLGVILTILTMGLGIVYMLVSALTKIRLPLL